MRMEDLLLFEIPWDFSLNLSDFYDIEMLIFSFVLAISQWLGGCQGAAGTAPRRDSGLTMNHSCRIGHAP